MNDYKNTILSDEHLNNLFRSLILNSGEETTTIKSLIDMEAKLAFSGGLAVLPALPYETKLFAKLKMGFAKSLLFKSFLSLLITGTLTASAFYITGNYRKNETSVPYNGETAKGSHRTIPQQNKSMYPIILKKEKTNTSNTPLDSPGLNILQIDSLYLLQVAMHTVIQDSLLKSGILRSTIHKNEITKSIQPKRVIQKKFKSGTLQKNYKGNKSNDKNIDTIFSGIRYLEIKGLFCDVNVHTGVEDQVHLTGAMHFESKGLKINRSDYQLHYEYEGTTLKVIIENKKKHDVLIFGYNDYGGWLDFEVPEAINLKVLNSGGSISVNGLSGKENSLENRYGNIIARKIKSDLDIVSGSGDITVETVTGNLNCKSAYGDQDIKDIGGKFHTIGSSGNITASDLKDNADITANYGDITVAGLHGNLDIISASGHVDIKSIEGTSCNIKCSYGDIVMNDIRADIKIASNSGDINLMGIVGNSKISSAYGNIDIKEVKGDIKCSSASGHITIKLLDGDADIFSAYGDVTLIGSMGDLSVDVKSGNITGRDITLSGKGLFRASYGDVTMKLRNPVNELSYQLETLSGLIRIKKDGVILQKETGKLIYEKGIILVECHTSTGDQLFE